MARKSSTWINPFQVNCWCLVKTKNILLCWDLKQHQHNDITKPCIARTLCQVHYLGISQIRKLKQHMLSGKPYDVTVHHICSGYFHGITENFSYVETEAIVALTGTYTLGSFHLFSHKKTRFVTSCLQSNKIILWKEVYRKKFAPPVKKGKKHFWQSCFSWKCINSHQRSSM